MINAFFIPFRDDLQCKNGSLHYAYATTRLLFFCEINLQKVLKNIIELNFGFLLIFGKNTNYYGIIRRLYMRFEKLFVSKNIKI